MARMGDRWDGATVLVALMTSGASAWAANAPDASLGNDAGAAQDASLAGEAGGPAPDAAVDAAGGSLDAGVTDGCEPAPCPDAEPAVGDPCDPTSFDCEYGDDPRYECNRVYSCESGHFKLESFPFQSPSGYPDAGGCPTTVGAGCPPSRASLTAGAACTPSLRCTYPEGECVCIESEDPGVPSTWECDPYNLLSLSDATCPDPRPRFGTPCSQSGYCAYEFDCSYQVCSCGEWTWSYQECPPPPPPAVNTAADGGGDFGFPTGADSSTGTITGEGPSDSASGGGCGCHIVDRRTGSGSAAVVMLAIALGSRRRSRRPSRGPGHGDTR
jgi:hypothetical protein